LLNQFLAVVFVLAVWSPLPLAGKGWWGEPRDALFDASRFATSAPAPRVEARARCAAASPPARRSRNCQQVAAGRCLNEARIAAIDAGLSNSASAGPIGCTSGLDA